VSSGKASNEVKSLTSEERLENWRSMLLEKARTNFKRTYNPLYVWHAIGVCNYADHPPRSLPEWCLEYVVTMACRLESLGQLRDERRHPWREDGESDEAYFERYDSWTRKKITPKQATSQLAAAMFLTRPGWNAFARYAADREREAYEGYLRNADSGRKAAVIKKFQKHWNLGSDAAVARRIKSRNRLHSRVTKAQGGND
jgi:hypothetical protein